MFFRPKSGPCWFCEEETTFPSNWKNDWFICDECLDSMVKYLRRKEPAGVVKTGKKKKLTTLWKPFKKMDVSVLEGLCDFLTECAEHDEEFEATKICCDENFELDEAKGLFRVTMEDGYYSPILPLSLIKDYYVQDVYQEYDPLLGLGGVDAATRAAHGLRSPNGAVYTHSVMSFEIDNPYIPFLDFPFLSEEEQPTAMLTEGKAVREKADAELAEILGRKTSDTRVLELAAMSDMMEFNPYSKSALD